MGENDEVEVGTLPTTKQTTAITRREGAALQEYGGAKSFPLADLAPEEFTTLVSRMKTHIERLRQVKRELMIPGVHYIVPGERDPEKIKKAAEQGKVGISKAGAEFLLKLHTYVARIEYTVTKGDPANEETPAITVDAICYVYQGNIEGPLVGMGVGACNSWETKYRYRNAQRKCPACGVAALVFQKEAKGGEFRGKESWWCGPFKGGCSANFAGNDERIIKQEVGKVANTDVFDQLNTFVKMGAKRAFTDGSVRATGSSDLFIPDVEDIPLQDQERMRRELEHDAEETTDKMFGPRGNPDDWREETGAGTTRPANGAPAASGPPAAASAPSRPPASAGQAEGPKPATDRQKGALHALLAAKLGIRGDAAQGAELESRFGIIRGFDAITVRQASDAIAELNKMPDAPKEPAPAQESRTAARTTSPAAENRAAGPSGLADTIENRATLTKQVRAAADEVERIFGGRKVIAIEDGVAHLVGGNELAVLKLRQPYPLEYFDVDQLTALGKYLKSEIDRKTVAA